MEPEVNLWKNQQARILVEQRAYLNLLDQVEREHQERMKHLSVGLSSVPVDFPSIAVTPPPAPEKKAGGLKGSFRKGEWEISLGRYYFVVYLTKSIGVGIDLDLAVLPCWTVDAFLPFVSVGFGRHDWPPE